MDIKASFESPSLKIHTTNQVLKVLVWVKIGCVKSSLNGENSPNLVTLELDIFI